MQAKSVLVVGGGATGHQIAYQLRDAAHVTLVDPKTYWEVPMAVPRLLVEPQGLPARLRYDDFLGSAKHVQGHVVAIMDSAARVKLQNGEEQIVTFDYAVLATGSAYVDPLIKAQAPTEEERASEISEMNQKLRNARSVVVAGGGPVGVEIAAELRESMPHLEVTLVHDQDQLLHQAPSKFAGWAQKTLTHRGVTVYLGDLVKSPKLGKQPEDGKVITTFGRTIEADIVIWAAGIKPATQLIAASWPDIVDGNGLVRVDGFLRLQGHRNIFAAGDIISSSEARLAIVGGLHVKSIVTNLKRLLSTSEPNSARLKPYTISPPGTGMGKIMIVTLGRRDGLTSLPFGQFRASFLARTIKARDMLVGTYRKAVGLQMPSPATKTSPHDIATHTITTVPSSHSTRPIGEAP